MTIGDGKPTSPGQLDVEALGSDLRQRRHDARQSVRQAAAAAEVSFMTFSRVESGSQPDLATFLKLCAWLRNPPETYLFQSAERTRSTLDEVARHLRSDPRLRPDAARKIADVVRDLYSALASEQELQPAVACHLRAAKVLRPGVADRLGSLLSDMHSRLEAMDEVGTL